jgi:general secretion pathway protein B
MSFILDALKKSEADRQRQSVPGLMDTRVANRGSRLPMWAVLLGVLLAANMIVLAVVLIRSNSSAGTNAGAGRGAAAPPAATTAAVQAEAASSADHFSPLDPSPVYAPEIPVPSASAPASASVENAAPPPAPRPAAVPRLADELKAPPLHSVRHADPVLTDEDAKADGDEILPTINELSLSGSQSLPDLHLDVHVYGTKPSERFVFINMRKYHEGTTLQEGPTVEHIRRDGVILNYHGLRFLLPRQS